LLVPGKLAGGLIILTVEEKKLRTGLDLSWCQSRILQSALQLKNTSGTNGDHLILYTGPWNRELTLSVKTYTVFHHEQPEKQKHS